MTDPFKDEIYERGNIPFRKRRPTDRRAVYGFARLGDRAEPTSVPHYRDSGALADAIRTVEPGDRVRVNDKPFYTAVEGDTSTGEGFVYETDRGARRQVTASNPTNQPQGTFDSPWLRRLPGLDSLGEVNVLEVKWSD
jgi:hypothetical protein